MSEASSATPVSPLLPGAGHTVLVGDGDVDAREALVTSLERSGFAVVRATTGREVLERARSVGPDVVVLEVTFPDLPGFEVCRELRRAPETEHVAVVFASARADEIDRVVAFEVGADDFVAKPYSLREVSLRVVARLRERRRTAAPQQRGRFGVLEIDPLAHRVFVRGQEVELTPTEYRLLAALARESGRIRSRADLVRSAFDRPHEAQTRAVDTHIKRLRKKLGPAASYIRTLRGLGYRFSPPERGV